MALGEPPQFRVYELRVLGGTAGVMLGSGRDCATSVAGRSLIGISDMENKSPQILNDLSDVAVPPRRFSTNAKRSAGHWLGLVVGFSALALWSASAWAAVQSDKATAVNKQQVAADTHVGNRSDRACRSRCESKARRARRSCYSTDKTVAECRNETDKMIKICIEQECPKPEPAPEPEPGTCPVDCEAAATEAYLSCIGTAGLAYCPQRIYWGWEFCSTVICDREHGPNDGPEVLGGKKPNFNVQPAPEPEPEPEPDRGQCLQSCEERVSAARARCQRINAPVTACSRAIEDLKSDCRGQC